MISFKQAALLSDEEGAWIRYVTTHSPLATKDIAKHKLFKFMKGYKLNEAITTKEIIEIAGRGWDALSCMELIRYNHED